MNMRLALAYTRLLIMAVVVILLLLSGGVLVQAIATSNADGSPAWARPTVTALKRIGTAPSVLSQPNFQSNLDCTPITYRQVSDHTMRTGCFVATAYGYGDPDSGMVIFNSTDEGLPLAAYTSQQVLTPWPGSVAVLALSPAMTGGTYISLYRNLTGVLEDQFNALGQLAGKHVIKPPDLTLTNVDGSKMIINPQTVAFSANGSWLVVETLTGSFVRINLATLDVVSFAPAYGTQGSPALLKSQVSITNSGRFVAIENDVAGSFKVYDLSTCQGDKTSITTLSCDAHEYLSYVNAQIAGLKDVRHLRFVNEELLSFVADYSDGAAIFELSPTIAINSSINYLALGDSYTSGEGAFDYLLGTDSLTNSCHLSLGSYPLLITQLLYNASGGHSVACSGAKINDVRPLSPLGYRGQATDATTNSQITEASKSQILADYSPGYVSQTDFVTQYQPGVITVSIGGNDIGFGDILKNCVIPHLTLHFSDGVCYNTYEDRLEVVDLIDRTIPKWTTLFRQLTSSSPMSKIYAIGYPQIFYDKGKCPINVQLSKSELEFSAEITSYINGAIQQAASVAGINYVDVSKAFFSYRLCETNSYDVAVNGLTAGKDMGVFGLRIFGTESYHPNAFGHYLLKNAVLDATDKFSVMTGTPLTGLDKTLLNAPSSGRRIYSLLPSDNIGQSVIDRGTTTAVSVDGVSYGLKPNTVYSLSLDKGSTPITNSVKSDELGNISTSFVMPNEATVGVHSLDVIGTNQIGQTVDVRQSIYVTFSAQDADGDGIINSEDSCVGEINSGIDADGDGIDDICDNFIGQSTGSAGSVSLGSSNTPASDKPATNNPETTVSSTAPESAQSTALKPPPQSNPKPESLNMPSKTTAKAPVSPIATRQSASYRNIDFNYLSKAVVRIVLVAIVGGLTLWLILRVRKKMAIASWF